MAKKRVYELAKERGVSSKELLDALRAAGVDVKAAASTVDESVVAKLSGGGEPDGKGPKAEPAQAAAAPPPATAPGQAAPPRAEGRSAAPPAQGAAKTAPAQASTTTQRPSAPARPAAQPAPSSDGGGAPPRPRPKRPADSGDRPAAAPGRRRRVVIDSQASRRPTAPQPPPQQRRRRSRGRGAPPPEPTESAPATAVAEPPALKIPSGATVREVAEHLGIPVADVIKKLMQLGEMASITQTLSDEAIGVLADEFRKRVEVVHVGEEEPAEEEFVDEDADLQAAAGRDDHGSRRPRKDLPARCDPRDRGRSR
jgi:translation initiation factor IF-2